MNAIYINTQKYAQELEQGGFTPEQASIQAEIFLGILNEYEATRLQNMATKPDLDEFRYELRLEIEKIRTELSGETGKIHAEIERVRTEMSREASKIRAEMGEKIDQLHAETEKIRAEMGGKIEQVYAEIGKIHAEIEKVRSEMFSETGRIRVVMKAMETRLLKWQLAIGFALVAIMAKGFNWLGF